MGDILVSQGGANVLISFTCLQQNSVISLMLCQKPPFPQPVKGGGEKLSCVQCLSPNASLALQPQLWFEGLVLYTAIPEHMGAQCLGTSSLPGNGNTQFLTPGTKVNSPEAVSSCKHFLQPSEPTNIAGSTRGPGVGVIPVTRAAGREQPPLMRSPPARGQVTAPHPYSMILILTVIL